MTKSIVFLLFWISLVNFNHIQAQSKRIMLFEEYGDGKVILKNKQEVVTKLNYDTANKKMMYLKDGVPMILMNDEQVDSVYIDNRRFISLHGLYLEVVAIDTKEVFIDWSIKERYKGNRGAYGQVTQNKVESINTAYWTNSEYKKQLVEVRELENSNNYWFFINDKPIKCKSIKDLIKVFPDRKNDILAFVNEKGIDFKNASDAVELIGYCLEF